MRHISILAGLILATSSASAENVHVTVYLVAPDALQVRYELPATCRQLPFVKTGSGAAQIRSHWQALDNCGKAGGDTLARGTKTCKALNFRVPAASDKVAGYPGSFPTGEGIYAHMSNYAVEESCGAVSYRFAGPGTILTGMARHEDTAAALAGSPALLFPMRLPKAGTSLDYFDPAVPAATTAHIRELADQTARWLHNRMPGAQFQRPIVTAAVAKAPGDPNVGGSSGDMLHLALFNWPAEPSPEVMRLATKLATHEMSHRFQMRDAVDDYTDARLIHEGGGEFLRWMVSLHHGWLTPQEAAAELDDALATCMLTADDRRWHDLTRAEIGSNQLEYQCGLAAYVYAMAARQGKGDAIARIDDFYRQLRKGAKPDFAQAMECGEQACKPKVLPAVLDGAGPMRQQWANVLDETGLAMPVAPTQRQTDAMALRAMSKLMREDCQGKASITPTNGSVLLDTLPGCTTLRKNVEVVQVEGLPLFGGPQALPAMSQACAARHEVVLGLKDGTTMAMPCRTPYNASARMYAADIGKIMRALGVPQVPDKR
ncbi:hypothetical protein [Pseudoduganella violaceinigra]|uniref:hypothetical protein n=1 Tax=Pseudoduganella violaceinigra TaxID=246602 RepID=UPI0004883519|nr:hypothetical protein [Pseudoduganella violaceinigra]